MMREQTSKQSKPLLTRRESLLATPEKTTEQTASKPLVDTGCCIRGCIFLRAEGDIVYCAGHRMMARTDTLWPEVNPEPESLIYRQIGPTTWELTDWAKAHCIKCPEFLAPGDTLYCTDHRRWYEAESALIVMPWEARDAVN
jgi:hypothetical protein